MSLEYIVDRVVNLDNDGKVTRFIKVKAESTERKPVDGIREGSSWYEKDTGKLYIFNAKQKKWIVPDDNPGSGGSSGGGGSALAASPMISTTYAELKALRDNGTLIPGMQYRITDYSIAFVSRVSELIRVVPHPYDIIVVADNENTLNTNARACLHEGDNYYSAEGNDCDLSKWELKYSIDIPHVSTNSEAIDTEKSKGFVYYLKDEFDNECDYDFKQIQFSRYKITKSLDEDLVRSYSSYLGLNSDSATVSDTADWFYTFSVISGPEAEPGTVIAEDGSIGRWKKETWGGRTIEYVLVYGLYNRIGCSVTDGADLNGNVFIAYEGDDGWSFNSLNRASNTTCNGSNYNNVFNDCGSILLGYGSQDCVIDHSSSIIINHANTIKIAGGSNIFIMSGGNDIRVGLYCRSITVKSNCSNIEFMPNCYTIEIGSGCSDLFFDITSNRCTLGNSCTSNVFGGMCNATFGDSCMGNKIGYATVVHFGNSCNYNTIGATCNVTFGDNCAYNCISDQCQVITFANECGRNSLGTACRNISFADDCKRNNLDDDCTAITFNDSCNSNRFASQCKNIDLIGHHDGYSFGYNCTYIRCSNTLDTAYKSNSFEDSCQCITFGANDIGISNYHLFRVRGVSSNNRVNISPSATTEDPTYVIGGASSTFKTIKLADLGA